MPGLLWVNADRGQVLAFIPHCGCTGIYSIKLCTQLTVDVVLSVICRLAAMLPFPQQHRPLMKVHLSLRLPQWWGSMQCYASKTDVAQSMLTVDPCRDLGRSC